VVPGKCHEQIAAGLRFPFALDTVPVAGTFLSRRTIRYTGAAQSKSKHTDDHRCAASGAIASCAAKFADQRHPATNTAQRADRSSMTPVRSRSLSPDRPSARVLLGDIGAATRPPCAIAPRCRPFSRCPTTAVPATTDRPRSPEAAEPRRRRTHPPSRLGRPSTTQAALGNTVTVGRPPNARLAVACPYASRVVRARALPIRQTSGASTGTKAAQQPDSPAPRDQPTIYRTISAARRPVQSLVGRRGGTYGHMK
jgi:hypothetical protein